MQPVTRVEFAAQIAPCLQLVAPVGMDLESQDTWMEAAYKALEGIPWGLLKRGAEAAMLKADHPAKIVPTIMAEIRETWDARKRNASASGQPMLSAPKPADPEYCTPDQAKAILKEFGIGSRFGSERV